MKYLMIRNHKIPSIGSTPFFEVNITKASDRERGRGCAH